MAQETLVVNVPKAQHAALRARIGVGPFEFRAVPHAVFSVKGAGAVATLYSSGKFVVQAADPRAFLASWTDLEAAGPGAAPAAAESPSDAPIDVGVPVTGSDEAGKGDYFGPLVVAAVRVPDAGLMAQIGAWGVTDSKALSDSRALQLGHHLRGVVEHAIERLDPIEYNAEWDAAGSLNPLLAGLHGKVLAQLAQRGEAVVVDQFERHGLVARAVAPLGVRLTEVPRAERHAAVAAASVLARQEFLLGLQELSERFDVQLRKGAGEPVDEAAALIVREHGSGALERVAKMHFKNTQKVLRRFH
ncbi:MAG: ribonuclease HIII [Planctomycetota bacterium]